MSTAFPPRPTPETDAQFTRAGMANSSLADFARKLERERDEAREALEREQMRLVACDDVAALESERDQLSRDLSSLLAADCLNGHDAVEGAQNGIAMREAIKEAHGALTQDALWAFDDGEPPSELSAKWSDKLGFMTHGPNNCRAFFNARKAALAKLQPLLKP